MPYMVLSITHSLVETNHISFQCCFHKLYVTPLKLKGTQGLGENSKDLHTDQTTGCGAKSTSLRVQRNLLATGEKWKLAWFRYVTRHDSLSETILQGTLEGG